MNIRLTPAGQLGRYGLMLGGGVVGYVLFLLAPEALIGAISKTAAVFIGTVWITVMSFALKVADVTESPGLTTAEHRALEVKARSAVKRVWVYAAGNVLAAALVLVPSVVIGAEVPLSALAAIAAGIGAGFSTYSVVAHAIWQEELRRFRYSLREREREAAARNAIASSIKSSELPTDMKEAIGSRNRFIEWPSSGASH